jgi:hypothetical protein
VIHKESKQGRGAMQLELTVLCVCASVSATASRENQLSEVAMLLHWFDRRHVQLLLESQANERESLNVGQSK